MELCTRIQDRFPSAAVQGDFSFARHTTIGTGGIAAAAVFPRSGHELAELLTWLQEEDIPHCLLGAGANVLAADAPFQGVVIKFSRMMDIALLSDGNILAQAGVTGGALLRFAAGRGRGGLEMLSGIPMTVGGAVAMNAGVSEGHIGDFVVRVTAVCNGKLTELNEQECRFSQKDSIFLRKKCAVVSVMLRTRACYSDEIARRRCYFLKKREHLPKGRSMGCVFVNPPEGSAGALIEACGLKGMRVGDAYVSLQHANFIINEGRSSRDIDCLIRLVSERVKRRTGIRLREEIQRLP